MPLLRLLKLDFLPTSAGCGLCALRIWLGLSMLLIHGWDKLKNFNGTVAMFHDKMGFATPLAWAAVLAESVCAALLVLGLYTRLAALVLLVEMAVAFIQVHHHLMGGTPPGELSFLYLGGFFALFLGGGGKFALDGKSSK